MTRIAEAFREGTAPVPSQVVCGKLNLPAEFGEKILNHLVAEHLLLKTSEPDVGFVLARAPENIKLTDISIALAKAGFAQEGENQFLRQIIHSHRQILEQYTLAQLIQQQQTGGPRPI